MKPRRINPVDRAQRLMRTLGWSFGDVNFFDGQRVIWRVYAHRGEDQIIVRASSQAEAWDEALRQAGVVQRG